MEQEKNSGLFQAQNQKRESMGKILREHGVFIFRGMIFPILLAVMIGIGNQAATQADVHLLDLGLWLQILILAVTFIALFAVVDYCLGNSVSFVNDFCELFRGVVKPGKALGWFSLRYEKGWKAYCTDALRIWVCWVPYFILLFPGVVLWDTGDQLAQMYGIPVFGQAAGQLFDHHPFFVAYLFAGIIKAVQFFTHSLKLGVFAVVLLQTLGAAAVFAYGLRFAQSYGASSRIVVIASRLIKYFPVIPILYCSLIKDSIHSLFFVWWVILFAQAVLSHQESLKSPRFISAFFFAGLLASLTKKTGAYIVAVCVLFLLFQKAKAVHKVLSLLCGILPAAIVIVILPAVAYTPLNIVKGGPQAPLAVPIEMLARVAHTHPDAASPEQRKVISSFLIYDWEQIGKQYDPFISDAVTGFSVKDSHQAKAFMKVWAEQGIRHPRQYAKAFLTIESGWISLVTGNQAPAQPQVMRVMTATRTSDVSFGRIASPDWKNPVNNMVFEGFVLLTQIPVINTLFLMCLWTACIPMYLLYWLWTRKMRSEAWLSMVPYFISVASLAIYPVSQALNDNPTRYMFHTIVLVPIVISILSAIAAHQRVRSISENATQNTQEN